MKKNHKYSYFKEKLDRIIDADYRLNDTLLERMARLSPDGMIMEFGVYEGTTINRISNVVKTTVYGFDSFEGLPEDWNRGMGRGFFKCDVPKVNENVQLVIGFFDTSLTPFLETHTDSVGFCHIDCDLYSSTKTVLDLLKPRFNRGTMILFDELANYPDFEHHEYKAFLEFLADTDFDFEYVGRRRNESFGFKLT